MEEDLSPGQLHVWLQSFELIFILKFVKLIELKMEITKMKLKIINYKNLVLQDHDVIENSKILQLS